MRTNAFILAAALTAALPVAASGAEPPPLVLREGLGTRTVATDTTEPVPANAANETTPATESPDTTITGSVPLSNPPVARVPTEPPVDTSDPAKGVSTGLTLRRTREEPDPFAPVGLRAGSFIWYPAVTLGLGYTTNALGTAGGDSAAFGVVTPELLIRSDWARHDATLTLRGSFERFFDDSTPDVPTADVLATGRIDLSALWSIDLAGNYNFSRQSVSDPRFPAGADTPPGVHAFGGKVGLNGNLGRTVFTLAGDLDRTLYEDASVGGIVIDQSDRDNTAYGGRFRVGYMVTPALTPFIETDLSRRVYDEPVDSNGVDRDSTGFGVRAGIAFNRDPVLQGEIAIGKRRETFDDPALVDLRTLTVDGSLAWSPTPLVTITTNLSTAISPATDPLSSGSMVYDGSLDLAYAYRRNVTFDVNGGIREERFEGTGQVDRTYKAGLGLTWKLNRRLWLTSAYLHQWLDSNVPGRDFQSDEVRVDLRLQH